MQQTYSFLFSDHSNVKRGMTGIDKEVKLEVRLEDETMLQHSEQIDFFVLISLKTYTYCFGK